MTDVAVIAGRGEPRVVKQSLMRRAMARRMVEAATVPCFYLRVTADVTDLLAARKALRAERRDAGANASGGAPDPANGGGPAGGAASAPRAPLPSVNDCVLRAVALELREHPHVNASFEDAAVEVHPRVNVGVAVAVEGGLVVPAIYDADAKDAFAIAADVRAAAAAAANRKLSRELLADATFTVSNLGMYGIEDFDPVINPPQAAILGVGAAVTDGQGRQRMRLTLGCDHRVLTGAEGAPFLVGVQQRLERPEELLAVAA